MKILLVLLCMTFSLVSVGENVPTVPNSIRFAGLNLKLTDKARRKIQSEVDALTRNPKYFQIKVDRLQIYFPIIERVFREEGLPEDFKYLVLQESALISDAVSSSNAVGFWQFKKAAATEVGLRVDRNVDERLNIVSSTRGAAKYLKKNNRVFFDNWIHALLAYQQGPGGAQKLVNKKYRGSNSMPIDNRTHWYVIKFLAHKIAFEQVKSATPKLFLVEYYEGQGKTLKDISSLKGMDYQRVQKYNKWLKKGKVPTDKPYAVILPYEDNSGALLASKTKPSNNTTRKTTASARQSEYETHPARYPIIKSFRNRNKGIKVNGIKAIRIDREMDINTLAERTGVTAKRLLYYNDVKANKKAQKGELWYLRAKRSKAKEAYHIVEAGEDLWTISQKYGIKLSQLRKKNRIPKRQPTVKQGRLLWLMETRPAGTSVVYLTPKTETPKSTTTRNSVKPQVSESKAVAKNTNHEPAKPVENPAVKETPAETQPTGKPEPAEKSIKPEQKVHQVQSGETLYGIAKTYGLSIASLKDWNKLDDASILSVGQELFISPPYSKVDNKTELQDQPESRYEAYKVRKGDTLYQIARQHQMTVQQLMELNQKTDFNLKIGEELKVAVSD